MALHWKTNENLVLLSCGRQPCKIDPSDSCLLVFIFLANPPTWLWAGPSNLLLTYNMAKMPGIYFHDKVVKDWVSSFLHFFLAGILSGSPHCLPWWRGLPGKELSVAFSQYSVRNWGFSPTAQEELNLANNYLNKLESESFSSWALMWDCCPSWHLDFSLLRDFETEISALLCLDSWPMETEKKFCCLSF